MNDINHRLHEALGKCWKYAEYRNSQQYNPDYCADPRLVIEVMEAEYPEFIESVFSIDDAEYHSYRPEKRRIVFDKFVDLIMDTTGKLALLAIEFLEKEANDD
jgi:hypothetical protein